MKVKSLYSIFVLFYITLIGLFNGVTLLFLSVPVQLSINIILLFFLICFDRSILIFTYKEILFITFYLFFTILVTLCYFTHNTYGFDKLLKNVILSIINILELYLFYKHFKSKKIIYGYKLIFIFQILIQIVFLLLFIFRKKLGIPLIRGFILQDWSGRFQGSFSEPSCLGLWLGAMTFCLLMLKKTKIKYCFAIICLYILYSFCKAKFALLAVPLALVISPMRKINLSKKNNYELFFCCVIISVVCVFYDSLLKLFFYLISCLFDKEGSATYVTRFLFILSSIQNANLFPIGRGVGLNYEIYQQGLYEVISVANSYDLETWELLGYRNNPNCLGDKSTFSYILSNFGYLGLFVFLTFIKSQIQKHKDNFFAICLILFLFFESVFSGNMISFSAFPVIIFSKMALNTIYDSKEYK